MRIFIILGSGNSGAGAIHDYLLSRDDFFSPFNGKEFRLMNDDSVEAVIPDPRGIMAV